MPSSIRRQLSQSKEVYYQGYDDNESAGFVRAGRVTSLPKNGRKPGKGRLRRRNVR